MRNELRAEGRNAFPSNDRDILQPQPCSAAQGLPGEWLYQHRCWKWGSIQAVMTTVDFVSVNCQCYRLQGGEKPAVCFPHCHHLHLYLSKHHSLFLNKFTLPFPLAQSFSSLCKFLLYFVCFVFFFLFQEPSFLWSVISDKLTGTLPAARASPCSHLLLMNVFVPHGHTSPQLLYLPIYCFPSLGPNGAGILQFLAE